MWNTAHTYTLARTHVSPSIGHARHGHPDLIIFRWQVTWWILKMHLHLHCLSLHLSQFISKKILNTLQCSFKIWKCTHIYVFHGRIPCIICHMKCTSTFQPPAVNWICPLPIYFPLFRMPKFDSRSLKLRREICLLYLQSAIFCSLLRYQNTSVWIWS